VKIFQEGVLKKTKEIKSAMADGVKVKANFKPSKCEC
jgi:hypothetical protein